MEYSEKITSEMAISILKIDNIEKTKFSITINNSSIGKIDIDGLEESKDVYNVGFVYTKKDGTSSSFKTKLSSCVSNVLLTSNHTVLFKKLVKIFDKNNEIEIQKNKVNKISHNKENMDNYEKSAPKLSKKIQKVNPTKSEKNINKLKTSTKTSQKNKSTKKSKVLKNKLNKSEKTPSKTSKLLKNKSNKSKKKLSKTSKKVLKKPKRSSK
jgi:hypothetical protein